MKLSIEFTPEELKKFLKSDDCKNVGIDDCEKNSIPSKDINNCEKFSNTIKDIDDCKEKSTAVKDDNSDEELSEDVKKIALAMLLFPRLKLFGETNGIEKGGKND